MAIGSTLIRARPPDRLSVAARIATIAP